MSSLLALMLASCSTQLPSVKGSNTKEEVLFNGKNLDKFDYLKTGVWTLPGDGTIKGETTSDLKIKTNTFLVSKDQDIADFEATLWYKLTTENNSGVIYRAKLTQDPSLFRVQGYQGEGENDPLKGGFMYDEARRAWIASPGEFVVVKSKDEKNIISQVNNHETLIKEGFVNQKDWNFYRIVARGNHFMHYLNGNLAMEVVDEDPVDSSRTGSFCLQIHAGKPMTVFFKDVKVAKYTNLFGNTQLLFIDKLDGWKAQNASIKEVTFTSPNEHGLKARGLTPGQKLKAKEAVLTKGSMSRKVSGDGVVRLHVKGAGTVTIGNQTFTIPDKDVAVDGFAHLEFLIKDGAVDFSSRNKFVSTRSISGDELTISGDMLTVRNVLFIPFEKK
jgi:hypothetical protein